MNKRLEHARAITRRTFFRQTGLSLGAPAPANTQRPTPNALLPKPPHFAPRAKAVIYLHMSGAPPTLDLFDYKPKLVELNMQPCPESLLKGQRFAFIKGVPKMLGTPYKFARHGKAGGWYSETLPHIAKMADD